MRHLPASPDPSLQLERWFTGIGLMAALLVLWLGFRAGLGFRGTLALTSGTVLAVAGAGRCAGWQQTQARIAESVRVFAMARSGAVEGAILQTDRPFQTVVRAVEAIVSGTRFAVASRDRVTRWAIGMQDALADRREQSLTDAANLVSDAAVIEDASRATQHAEYVLAQGLETARTQAASAELATQHLAGEADVLTEAVRQASAQIERATSLATGLAETAFGAQKSVSGLSGASASLLSAAEQVQMVLQRAEILGLNAGIEAARAGEAGRGFAIVAGEIKNLAVSGGAALDAMSAGIREIKTQTDQMREMADRLASIVEAQHAFGHAMAHASALQADMVGRLLARASDVKRTTSEAHACLQGLQVPEGLGAARDAQAAVERLPRYAEAMAQLLRGLPELRQITSDLGDKRADPLDQVTSPDRILP